MSFLPSVIPPHFFVFNFYHNYFVHTQKVSQQFSVITWSCFFFLFWHFQTYNSEHLWFYAPCLAILSLTISLSSSHSILCLCLFNTLWSCLPGIGCLRCDFQLMGWRGWSESGGYGIGGEKRRGRVDGWAKCFGSESIGVNCLLHKETLKVEWKVKGLRWSAGNSFFMRNCTVLQQRIEPEHLNPFFDKGQQSKALKR